MLGRNGSQVFLGMVSTLIWVFSEFHPAFNAHSLLHSEYLSSCARAKWSLYSFRTATGISGSTERKT